MLNFSVIVINYQSADYVVALLKKWLEKRARASWEMLIVENGSPNQLEEKNKINALLAKLAPPDRAKTKLIINQENLGFGGGNNLAAAQANGEWLFLLNADTLTESVILDQLMETLEKQPQLMVLAPRLVLADGKTKQDYAAGKFPSWWRTILRLNQKQLPAKRRHLIPVDWVSGAAMLVNRICFDKVGGFDENYFMYFEDVDLNWTLKKAFPQREIAVDPHVKLIHLGGKSIGLNAQRYQYYFTAQDYFWQKNYSAWQMVVMKFFRAPYKWWRIHYS